MIYCAAAIRRIEETALEDLNPSICFIHDHKFFSAVMLDGMGSKIRDDNCSGEDASERAT